MKTEQHDNGVDPIKIDLNELKKKIQISRKSVENEFKPFDIEAFKIIFSKLINNELEITDVTEKKKLSKSDIVSERSNIDKDTLNRILTFDDNAIIVREKYGKNNDEILYNAIIAILTVWSMFNEEHLMTEWELEDSLNKSNIHFMDIHETVESMKDLIFTKGGISHSSKHFHITDKGFGMGMDILKQMEKSTN